MNSLLMGVEALQFFRAYLAWFKVGGFCGGHSFFDLGDSVWLEDIKLKFVTHVTRR